VYCFFFAFEKKLNLLYIQTEQQGFWLD